MTTLAAIETSYAGCRFRSRLEARWAVFFDHLGVEWQYEPQGYTVGPNATPYLPDFWLPASELWVEVKGQLDHEGLETLIYAASSAGLPTGPGRQAPPLHDLGPWTERILILGQVPTPGMPWLHTQLDAVVGDLIVASYVTIIPFQRKHRLLGTVNVHQPRLLNGYLAGERMEAGQLRDFVDGIPAPILGPGSDCGEAFRAARSARFEHGESGAPATVTAPRSQPPGGRGLDSIDGLARRFDLSTVDGRVELLRRAAPWIAREPEADAEPLEEHLAGVLGMELEPIRRAVAAARTAARGAALAREEIAKRGGLAS